MKELQTYYEGLGVMFSSTPKKIDKIMKNAGLDYLVESKPIFLEDGTEIEDKRANVRSDNNQVLGVVGKDYCLLQNSEGFEFIEDLIAEGAEIVSAGNFDKGRCAYIVAKTKTEKILDENFSPCILFTNSHDGSGSIKAMFTPIYNSTKTSFILAEKTADIKISVKHSKNVKDRLKMAETILQANKNYIQNIRDEIGELARTTIRQQELETIIAWVSGWNENDTNIKQERAKELMSSLLEAYDNPKIAKWKGTLYGVVLAIADVESHREPLRNTNNPEIYLNRVMLGMTMLNNAIKTIDTYRGIVRRRGN